MWKWRLPDRTFWAHVFFVMSPFFPANNWLEVAAIGSLCGWVAKYMPGNFDLGFLRAALYIVYNAIGLFGYFIFRGGSLMPRGRERLALLIAVAILLLSGLIREPWGTLILTAAGIYFIVESIVRNRMKKQREAA
jgi:hypothetical protein